LKLVSLVTLFYPLSATVYIVDGSIGNNANTGNTIDEPLKTISECVKRLRKAGDECQIREGYYHETLIIDHLKGTKDKPIKITGYTGEHPVIDGTELIQPAEEEWRYNAKTRICSTKVDKDIIALFYERELLTLARWPNALWSNKTIFDNRYWRQCPDSLRGTIVDKGLAEANINFQGAMAILNVGSFITYVREVLNFEAGSDNFTYKDDFGDIKFANQQYYLEAKLDLLDAPEEWYYDKLNKMLHVILPSSHKENGTCPSSTSQSIRGRTIDYAVEIRQSSYITLANITFFASNILADYHVRGISLDSLDFKFPSSSHRVLKSNKVPLITKMKGDDCSVVNCTFLGSDGPALEYRGKRFIVCNNEFSYNAWAGLSFATIMSWSDDGEFSQNTLWYNGKPPGIRYRGHNTKIFLNHIVGLGWGKIQSDGASLQISSLSQTGIDVTHNWVHDSPKKGIRFDGESGVNGTVSNNVVWNIYDNAEIFTKGDYHIVKNNVAFDKDKKCAICLPSMHWGQLMNNYSVAMNNGATYMADGGHYENNFASENVDQEMVDTSIQDFRPVPGGNFTKRLVTIGAYEESSTHYWIPGRQLYKTSYPIPPDGKSVKLRSDLICRIGYKADRHHFYLGQSADSVNHAGPADPEYQYTLENGANVFGLPPMEKQKEYFWRVDAQRGGGGDTYKGDVWKFSLF